MDPAPVAAFGTPAASLAIWVAVGMAISIALRLARTSLVDRLPVWARPLLTIGLSVAAALVDVLARGGSLWPDAILAALAVYGTAEGAYRVPRAAAKSRAGSIQLDSGENAAR